MSRDKAFESAAERQRAYRERKRAALEAPDLPAVDANEMPERPVVSDDPDLAVRELGISLEDYVAHWVAVAIAQSPETNDPLVVSGEITIHDRLKDTLERVEKYARWRYAGVLDGSVGTL